MKNLKWFICGVLVGSIGISTVFAAGGIKSAYYNTNMIIFDGKTLDLSGNQMVSIIKDRETNVNNYMPVRTVLEQMGYTVQWDGGNGAVIVTSGPAINKPLDLDGPSPGVAVTASIFGSWQIVSGGTMRTYTFTRDGIVTLKVIENGSESTLTGTFSYSGNTLTLKYTYGIDGSGSRDLSGDPVHEVFYVVMSDNGQKLYFYEDSSSNEYITANKI